MLHGLPGVAEMSPHQVTVKMKVVCISEQLPERINDPSRPLCAFQSILKELAQRFGSKGLGEASRRIRSTESMANNSLLQKSHSEFRGLDIHSIYIYIHIYDICIQFRPTSQRHKKASKTKLLCKW